MAEKQRWKMSDDGMHIEPVVLPPCECHECTQARFKMAQFQQNPLEAQERRLMWRNEYVDEWK